MTITLLGIIRIRLVFLYLPKPTTIAWFADKNRLDLQLFLGSFNRGFCNVTFSCHSFNITSFHQLACRGEDIKQEVSCRVHRGRFAEGLVDGVFDRLGTPD
jgi:hypothetical protein